LKKNLKNLIPVLIGLGFALIVIFSLVSFFPGALTAEKAVTGYLKASMIYDANNIVKYSSDYVKVNFYRSKDFSNNDLKDKLKKQYAEAINIYANSKISFSIISKIEIDKDSEEYATIVDNYKYITGKDANFSDVRQITVKIFIDGKENPKVTAYAIKSGISWFYLSYQD